MDRDGLVTRTVTPSVPVRVDHELTELGRDLVPVIGGVRNWAEQNMDRILSAWATYEQQ